MPRVSKGQCVRYPGTILASVRLFVVLLGFAFLSTGIHAESLELLGKLEYGLDNPCAQGNRVYVNESGGIRILDVSNPQRAERLGKLPALSKNLMDIETSGTLVFGLYYEGMLLIADASDPTSPTVVSISHHRMPMGGLRLENGYAYSVYSTWSSGTGSRGIFYILDIHNLTSPTLKSTYPIVGESEGFCVVNGKAYIANKKDGLLILDVSNPTSATFLSRFDTPDIASDVVVAKGYAYVADSTDNSYGSDFGSVQIIDVQQLSKPVLKSIYRMPSDAWNANRLTLSGNHLFATGFRAWGGGMLILDASNPTSLLELSRQPCSPEGFAVSNDRAFIRSELGLCIFDISKPATPTYMNRVLSPGGWPYDVLVDRGYAYMADAFAFCIIDVQNPRMPKFCGGVSALYPSPDDFGGWMGLAKKGDYVFIAGRRFSGFTVIDVSDPFAPEVAFCDQSHNAQDVAIAGEYGFVARQSGDKQTVWDISNPEMPAMVKTFGIGPADSVAVEGNKAYVAGKLLPGRKPAYLAAFDISNPLSPTLVSTQTLTVPTYEPIRDIAVKDGLVLVLGEKDIAAFLDEASGFRSLGTMPAPSYIIGKIAFSNSSDSGAYRSYSAYAIGNYLAAFNLKNPNHIFQQYSYPVTGGSIAVANQIIYSFGSDGLTLYREPEAVTRAKHWTEY